MTAIALWLPNPVCCKPLLSNDLCRAVPLEAARIAALTIAGQPL